MKPKIELPNRICTLCNDKDIQDEYHLRITFINKYMLYIIFYFKFYIIYIYIFKTVLYHILIKYT